MRTFVPGGAADALPAGWGARRVVGLDFPGPAALSADPVHTERLRGYLTDLLRPYELTLDDEALARGGQSYGEMAEALIGAAVPAGESVDLLVLAYAVPDIAPGRATTTRLSHVCPGRPMAFAVSDQGSAAAFTALRLIRAYAAGAAMTRALLLVVEQGSLPYDPGVPVTLPAAASGVAVLLGPRSAEQLPAALGAVTTTPAPVAAPGAVSAGPRPGTAAGGPASAVAEAIAELACAEGPVTAILGPALAAACPREITGAQRVRRADPGRPATGVWWELAAELAAPPPAPHRLLLADLDAHSGDMSLAVFTAAAADTRSAATTAAGWQR